MATLEVGDHVPLFGSPAPTAVYRLPMQFVASFGNRGSGDMKDGVKFGITRYGRERQSMPLTVTRHAQGQTCAAEKAHEPVSPILEPTMDV